MLICHSRVTWQSWHVYASLRPGSQVEWREKENWRAKLAERGLGGKKAGETSVAWTARDHVGSVCGMLKKDKCRYGSSFLSVVGVAVYSALSFPLIHVFARPIKAVRVWVSHLQPSQNLLNFFIQLLYRFSHLFFLFENQANHEIRFSTFFEVRSI